MKDDIYDMICFIYVYKISFTVTILQMITI